MDDDFEVSTNKRVDWDTVSDQYLSTTDRLNLRKLQGSDKGELLAPDADIAGIFSDEDDSVSVAHSLMKALELRSPEHLNYILLVLSSILRNDARRGQVFVRLQHKLDSNMMTAFSRVWLRDDLSSFCQGKAAICAAIILRWLYPHELAQEAKLNIAESFHSLNSFILREFKRSKNDQLISPLLALKGVISNEYFQNIFYGENGIEKLWQLMFENDNHRQVIYLTIYNLWALTFNHYHVSGGDEQAMVVQRYKRALLNGQLIDKLVRFIRDKKSTKITRVTLALFENLCNFENFNEMVVLFGLFPILESMENEEKTDDDELKLSVKNLLANLEKSVKILSSFERYEQEIRSSKLIWGPTHNESFWKKYSIKLEDDNYKLIRRLIELLDSKDPETVAVACYDIGEWSRFYPDAKSVIEKLNGKFKLMKLIEYPDPDVQQNALNAVQKVLVKNWKDDTTQSKQTDDK